MRGYPPQYMSHSSLFLSVTLFFVLVLAANALLCVLFCLCVSSFGPSILEHCVAVVKEILFLSVFSSIHS